MANVAVISGGDPDLGPSKSTLTFVDLQLGSVEPHIVNQQPATDDYVARGGSPSVSLRFFGYAPGVGAVYYGTTSTAGSPGGGVQQVYVITMGENEFASPPGTFTRIQFDLRTGLGSTARIDYGVGIDADGMYVAGELVAASGGSIPSAIYRLGFDGSIAKVTFIDSYKVARGSTCPILWRGPAGFRAFVQLGTDFEVDKRGASTQFNFISGASVIVDSGGARVASGVGFSRGPEFSGFFYGYQPLNNDPAYSYVAYLNGALPALSWTGVDAAGGSLTSIGFGSSTVHQEVSTIVASGGSYFRSNVDVGSIIPLASNSFGGGYVGELPPYTSASNFWTDLVYSLEIV